ncbi:DUF6776 family protein [Reinekea marinisedimentorum]|uniref:Uncharacterized protein n=1 Tax=Reinekea marinisedimentorum TaxID=230495 RepID=A0A4R3HSK9_9GAMM|nr:DUF6776 family protein [Reinekea marinisedimentorum]TCS36146.1 hypothetical protein BCF53_12729 [Reinekea marinisedimentorum]
MTRVKGTPQIQYVVVPHRPVRRLFLRMLLLIALLATVIAAYLYGSYSGVRHEQSLLNEVTSLSQQLEQGRERESELRQKVAVLENASFVDKGATEDVRRSNRELSDTIAELEKEIALYQGIMSPSVNSSGLTIQEVSLTPTAQDGRYRFKVMLTQVGNNSNYLQGFVGINLLGVQNGEITAYPLKDISADIQDVDIKFRYRYFQEFKGELMLPDNFTPDQLQVVAQSVGNKSARIERAYNWSDLENGNNVGQ